VIILLGNKINFLPLQTIQSWFWCYWYINYTSTHNDDYTDTTTFGKKIRLCYESYRRTYKSICTIFVALVARSTSHAESNSLIAFQHLWDHLDHSCYAKDMTRGKIH
jgi:hypothetical protein